MPAAIFNSGTVKILKDILKFKSDVQVVTGDSDDPTSVAKDFPQGSVYIQSGTGAVFVKQDAGSSTNWAEQADTSTAQTFTNKTIDADLNTLSNIDNDEIKAAAGIDVSKLAALTASRALASDGSGFLTPATTTAAELDFLSGATSNVQTQLNTLDSTISNFEWQASVLDKDLTAPPGSPSTGDRYLIGLDTTSGTATGAWATHDGEITEWDGAAWQFTTPTVGMFVAADDETDSLYLFGGVTWTAKAFESTTASLGLDKVGFDIRTDASLAGTGLSWTTGVIDINFGLAGSVAVSATDLASTSNGEGASLLGVEDTGGFYTATTVEGILAEIGPSVGTTDFDDSTFRVSDNGDSTKKIALEASGITTATVRTITMPDADVDLGNLVNANIDAAAGIEFTKMEALTANRATATDASGFVVVSAVTDTELGYLTGATSNIQTQIDGISGGGAPTVTSVSTNTSMANNNIYLVDTSGGAVTMTLPTPTTGHRVWVKDSTGSSNGNNISIAPNGGEEIDGTAANKVVDSNWDATEIVSDGTDWFIV